jgi:hypothetical protein
LFGLPRRSYNFDPLEILWTFSIFLEALAIVPQLIVLQRFREVENLDGHYIFLLGSYRALYILNWVSAPRSLTLAALYFPFLLFVFQSRFLEHPVWGRTLSS